MSVKDKVAVVTGAGSGIGKAIALKFAAEGAKVAIADLSVEAAQAMANEINAQYGTGTAMAVPMNVAEEKPVDDGIDAVVANFGRLDILVANAGIQTIESLDQFDFAKWKQLLAVHLDGSFLTTRAALRHMYKLGNGGSIIYMGSVHSKEASMLKAPYVTAKHGLIGLAKTGGQGRRQARRPCQCDLPGLRSHPSGRQADPRAGQEPRNHRGGGHQERDAARDRGWRIHHGGRCRPGHTVLRRLRQQCPDRSIAGRQPRLVHAVIWSARYQCHPPPCRWRGGQYEEIAA